MSGSARRNIDLLTDAGAVRRAIGEYDAIGRDAFNAKYGFAGAQRFWIVDGGRRYDAKSILLAAFGYQFPQEGPLLNDEVPSNRRGVRDTAERLGFEVVEESGARPRQQISAVTDAEAVEACLEEFLDVGREGFLRKYGYGPARSYFVLHRGVFCDSKAVAGCAYGRQFPDKGPLLPSQFSGGAETVEAMLTSLGFTVVRVNEEVGRKLEPGEREVLGDGSGQGGIEVADVEMQLGELGMLALRPPVLTQDRTVMTSQVTRLTRDAAFRVAVLRLYKRRCAACGIRQDGLGGGTLVQAAHIHARWLDGSDDPRNGVALCPNCHYAFDELLFGIGDDWTIFVNPAVPSRPEHDHVRTLEGKRLGLPDDLTLAPHPLFLKAHRDRMGPAT